MEGGPCLYRFVPFAGTTADPLRLRNQVVNEGELLWVSCRLSVMLVSGAFSLNTEALLLKDPVQSENKKDARFRAPDYRSS